MLTTYGNYYEESIPKLIEHFLGKLDAYPMDYVREMVGRWLHLPENVDDLPW